MKIGILTYHWVNNFGANLQAYSTVGYLKNNGFDPIIINWIPENLETTTNQIIPLHQEDAHKKFIANNLPCSAICRSDEDIIQVIQNEKIRSIIIGSDAVFRLRPFLSRIHLKKRGIIIEPKRTIDWQFPNPFWGSFIPLMKTKIPVRVMSVSSQNTNFKFIFGRLRKRINIALVRFNSITVRDVWTQKMIRYLTNNNIVPPLTPDPVFAYNQNIREQLSREEILKRFDLPEKYILISFRSRTCVNKEWLDLFKTKAERDNLKCVALAMPNGIIFDHPFTKVIGLPLSPEEWYGVIKYSSGYIGENMHPIVIALHNAIPFYSFDSYGIVKFKYFVNEKSSKIYDILSNAGFLKNRINVLGRAYKCPPPEEVLFEITDFDTSKCREFSILQQNNYNQMMKKITQL